MVDVLLVILISVLLGFIYLKDKEHNLQVNKLIKAVIAKNSQDYSHMSLSENTKLNMDPLPPLGPIDDDLIPVGQADEDTFDKMINTDLKPTVDDEVDAN